MKCPNCGQEFEGAACPNCGRPARSRGSRIAAVIVAVLLVLPLALFGACSAVFAANSGSAVAAGDGVAWLVAGCAAFGIIGALGFWQVVRKLWRG